MAAQGLWNQISTGATVYDQGGEKLGKVVEIDQNGQYLVVEKGWLFAKDFYVPADAISQVTQDGVQLSITKDALNDARYDSPPTTTAGAAYATGTTEYATTTQQTTTQQATPRAVAAGETVTDGDIVVPVREEELVVGKRSEEEGRVRVHKDVVEEQRTVSVPLEQEHVTVERVAFSGDANASDAFVERDIDVPVMGEEAVVGKQIRGVEEVRIHKDVVTQNQQVSDTVRKERVVVDGADADGHTLSDTTMTDETRTR